MLNHKKRW